MGKAIIFASNKKQTNMKKKSLLLTTLAILGLTTATMGQNAPSYVPTNGLVGWWPFNGNANDESGNGNNGTVNGATLTADRFGNANKAYSFDGVDDLIRISHQNQLNLMGDFTASIWFYISSIPTTNNNHMFLTKRDDNGTCCSPNVPFGFFITYQVSLAPLNFKMPVCAFANSGSYNFSASDSIISINTWSHLVFTYSLDTLKMFLNNTLINIEHFPNPSRAANTSDLLIGSVNRELGAEWMNGILDDIAIWNRALNPQEITDLYNGNICYQTITVTDTLLINMGIVTYNPVTYNNAIKIFPNPTNDHITIDYGNFTQMNGYQLRIENSLGQEVFQTSISQQSDYLNLNTWGGNGLYFVHIVDPQGNTIDIRKIVLQ
jgi:hypothetical protein